MKSFWDSISEEVEKRGIEVHIGIELQEIIRLLELKYAEGSVQVPVSSSGWSAVAPRGLSVMPDGDGAAGFGIAEVSLVDSKGSGGGMDSSTVSIIVDGSHSMQKGDVEPGKADVQVAKFHTSGCSSVICIPSDPEAPLRVSLQHSLKWIM